MNQPTEYAKLVALTLREAVMRLVSYMKQPSRTFTKPFIFW